MDTLSERMSRRVRQYVRGMIERGRTVIVYEHGHPVVWCTFFLFKNMEQVDEHYEAPVWELLLDFPDGKVIYVDKIICVRPWSLGARKELQRKILEEFPNLEWAVWHRPGEEPERCVIRRIRKDLAHEKV